MPKGPEFPDSPIPPRRTDANAAYAAFRSPIRRRILAELADQFPHTTFQLGDVLDLSRAIVRAHLEVLCAADLVVREPNPVDRRQALYRPEPSIRVAKTADGVWLDFGDAVMCCC